MRVLLLVATLYTAGAAHAQSLSTGLPGLSSAKKTKAPAPAQPSKPTDAPDDGLQKRLADARAELERLGQQVTTREGVPNDALIERRATAERLVRSYEQTRDNDRMLAETQRRRAELGTKAAAWTGFATPPPYSLLMAANCLSHFGSCDCTPRLLKPALP